MASRSARDGMRLLLDEHLSPSVAGELRRLGYDVIAVAERDDLRGLPDDEIFEWAATDGRAVVTFDVGDYLALVRGFAQLRQRHGGLVLMAEARSWSSGRAAGRLVSVLAGLMAAHPPDDAFADRVEWLRAGKNQSSSQR